MLSDTLSVYSKGGLYLILNPKVPAWIVTTVAGVAAIKEYASCLSFEETSRNIRKLNANIDSNSVINFLKTAESLSLFKEAGESAHVHKPYLLNGIYLNMTKKCNLKCTYCFAATREEKEHRLLTSGDYKKILRSVKNICGDKMNVVFTGGEPLLSENTIPAAEYAKESGFSARLLTNATLIDEKNAGRLAEVFDLFKISIDGSSEERHDYYRGSGSYKKTLRAVELLKAHNANVQLAMTVTRENLDDVPAMNKKWGDMLSFQPLFPLGRAKENSNALTGSEYYEALCVNENINPYADIANIINAHKANGSVMKCSLGDGELSVSCTGDVYPCQLLHADDFYLGNVHERTLEEIYNSPKNDTFKFHTVARMDKCRECDFRYLCGGACQARHYSETGSIDKVGDFCEYEKKGIVNGIISSCKIVSI